MAVKQSEILLGKVREAIQKKGWNTAALAEAMGEDRKRVRAVLGGKEPLTVDDFARMVEALQMGPEDLAVSPEEAAGLAEKGGETREPTSPSMPRVTPAMAARAEEDEDEWKIDPDGPQAEQVFRMGFGLGLDMLFLSDTRQLKGSGIPAAVLARFPDKMPIKLDAAFHRHNRPRFLDEGLELRLSFDQVYTCLFPWSAIHQVTLFPEAPEEEAPAPGPSGRPTLTLVRS